MGQALTIEAIAECIRSGGIWEAESNIEWLGLVSTPAAADRDASFTMERINLLENTAKASRRKCEFDQIREVPFVRKAGHSALAERHLAQSSSASRVTADVFSPSFLVAHLFCSFSFLPSLAMLWYPPGRACPNFELFDPSDCKEVASRSPSQTSMALPIMLAVIGRPSSFARV